MDDELIFQNKTFLSSKHAGKLAGYTNDYVARLCRQGKVEGRMVGRTWYAEERSFRNFVETNALQKAKRKTELSKERREEYVQAAAQSHPHEQTIFARLFGTTALQRVGVVAVIAVLLFGSVSMIVIGPRATVSHLSYGYESVIANDNVASVSESITDFFSNVWSVATNAFRSLALRDAATENTLDQEFTSDNSPLAQADKDRGGMVVVPSSGEDDDAERKREIEDAFSDEIQIIPDPDGRSGIIKPVFKDPEDQDYLYVLVPVEENATETNE